MNLACCFVKNPATSPETGGFSLFGKGRTLVVFLLAGSLLFSGCDILKSMMPTPDDGEIEGEEQPVPPDDGAKGEPVEGAAEMRSIKEKFGVTEPETAGVETAFKELSAFIKKNGLDLDPPVIKLGDWIDLDGGLTVAAYGGSGDGGFSSKDADMHWDSDLTQGGKPRGKMMRLIVVGINSFQTKGKYAYPGDDKPPQHVVFQFQHLPVKYRMNADGTNEGGYPASQMRKYLVPVDGASGSGNFLAGLKEAGVPEDALWGPSRIMSKNPGQQTINDLLWLPTEREMHGDNSSQSIANDETVSNQARLEYYGSNENRYKLYKSQTDYPNVSSLYSKVYWEASVAHYSDPMFCIVGAGGNASNTGASGLECCAPAFCVQ
jgi:hypothetical protein